MRAILYVASAATAIVATTVSAQAMAQARNFNIPAQPMQSALQSFGLQADRQVTFRPEDVRGHRSHALAGTFEPEDGLRRLIGSGSPLSISRTSSGVFVIQRAAQPRQVRANSLVTAAQPANTADGAPDQTVSDAPALEDIVVTAQKRAESLQDTPISIAVLGGQQLAERGITGLTDLTNGAIPSFRMVPFAGRASAYSVSMRGITSGDATQISRDTAVGIYVDGVYLGRVQGLGTELFELERIEVLRGPQGTLFGRNAVGGALNIVSKRPTGKLGIDQTLGIRNYDGVDVITHLNLPEFAGISVKLDGLWKERDGWVSNPLRGAWGWNQYKKWGVRAAALWEPADNLSFLYSFDTSKDRSSGGYAHILSLLPTAAPLAPLVHLEPHRVKEARLGAPMEPSVGKVHGHSLNAEWDISDSLQIRSITAYRKMTQSQYDNYAGSFMGFRPNGNFGRLSLSDVEQDQFSQELQIIGNLPRLKYVLGAFYFDEDASDSAYAAYTLRWNATGTDYEIFSTPTGGGGYPDRSSVNHVKSKALFAQATWTPPVLDDNLHLTGGLRYTKDNKRGNLVLVSGVPSSLGYRFTSGRVDPAFTVAYDFSRDVNAYVRWGRAFRAGGANSRSLTFRAFNEEVVSSWELGLKTELFDRRARLNVAIYDMTYEGAQIDFTVVSTMSTIETVNTTEDSKIRGLEADLTVVPVDRLTLSASYNYTHTKTPPATSPFTGAVQAVYRALTPKHAATVSTDYSLPSFSFGTIRVHADANYSSEYYPVSSSNLKSRPYIIVNGRLTLEEIPAFGVGEMSISLWGKNLFNREYDTYRYDRAGTGAINGNLAYFNEPRTYGLELN